MNPWTCALLITLAGAIGGVTNALMSDNGFILPKLKHKIWCPGFISNVLLGGFSAFASWAFYGSGANIELANITENQVISLRFSALAGAFLVGVAGARWLTNEIDKKLLKESIVHAANKDIPEETTREIIKAPATKILDRVSHIN